MSIGPTERRIARKVSHGTICAALIDPEEFSAKKAGEIAARAERAGVSIILVGGSTISNQGHLDNVVRDVKRHVTSPVVLFPGNITGISQHADAILFSSLLNSTNPYFIIGAQALASKHIYESHLEAIPMAYLVFGGESTTSFVGQVNAIPTGKPEIAGMYALAARFLGMRTLYLEAGSGSQQPIGSEVVKLVRHVYNGLLIVGGGITNGQRAGQLSQAGADVLVTGNLLSNENFEDTLREITLSIQK
jgi:phosphoglycerol geranylgeranyltransferase